MRYKEESLTLLQTLANACGAEFEDEQLAVECINELLMNVANSSNDIQNVIERGVFTI